MKTSKESLNPGSLVDMKFITADTGMTSKWFYDLIKRGVFPKQIKLGRMSRWKYSDYLAWKSNLEIEPRKAA